MSVYVKGMEMPTSCAQCACCDDDARFCHAAHQYIPMIGKPKFCPLVEVPTHDKHTKTHGVCSDELISRQAVMDAAKAVMKDILDSLPTRLEDGEEVYDVRTSELDLILGINKGLQNAIKPLPSETHEIRTKTHGVCSDTISRQDTINAIEHVTWYHQNRNGQMVSGANSDEHQAWYKAEDVYEAIEALPSANKSGHWTEENDKYHTAICSECGKVTMFETWGYAVRKYDFCPNCGSRNIEEGGEEDDL